MKYIKKINLIDTTEDINMKKVLKDTYNKSVDYYKNTNKNKESK